MYEMNDVPFLSRLLLLLPPSSSFSTPFSLAESRLSLLICRLSAVAGPKLDGLYSGVFLAETIGLPNGFVGVLVCTSGAIARLTLVNPELTAVKPPELMAVNPPGVLTCGAGGGASTVGVPRSELTEACSTLDACRAGESALEGVLMLECFMGLGAGLGVNGPPFSHSNC